MNFRRVQSNTRAATGFVAKYSQPFSGQRIQNWPPRTIRLTVTVIRLQLNRVRENLALTKQVHALTSRATLPVRTFHSFRPI